jgi:hypothetical protein
VVDKERGADIEEIDYIVNYFFETIAHPLKNTEL